MLNFKRYLNEEKNVHMEHVEDLIFNEGIVGARKAFAFVSGMRDMLAGHSKRKINATVKWDGAPAMFAGIDPADGKFFVAKKGLFAQTPKMYKTAEDIDRDMDGDLAVKFHIALEEFRKLGIKSGVYQGDLMFSHDTLKTETIDDEKYVTFQPNTIVYAVPLKSELATRIRRARIGIVWHTTYTGKSIQTMTASFGKGIVEKLKQTPTVWMDDANYKDVTGNAVMTAEETAKVTAVLSRAGSLLRTIPSAVLDVFMHHPDLLIRVKTFNNSKIRKGEAITNAATHAKELLQYIAAYYDKEAATKKTPAGKQRVVDTKKAVLGPIMGHIADLTKIYQFYNLITEAKLLIVKKMDNAVSMGTFLRTGNGLRATTPEGYVAIDHLTNGAVKFIDRLEFSSANFSPDIQKGWQR